MAEIRRVGSDKPVITRGMGGTAKLTPLVGHLQVDSTDDAAVSALVGNPATATRTALSAAYGRGISVSDPRFGGVTGDGVVDDTVAIKAAAAYARANGLHLFFPAVNGSDTVYLVTDTILDGPATMGWAWVGERSERGVNGGARTGAYNAVGIKFRPLDTTKPLARAYNLTAPTVALGPFVHTNLRFDLGDANGIVLGVQDPANPTQVIASTPATVTDGAGQAYIFHPKFEGCAFEATTANRVSDASGNITRSGRVQLSMTKAFEPHIDDVSFWGGDIQVDTWGCDTPTFENCRSQGSHLPLRLRGSGSFYAQHRVNNFQVEGWTFTPIAGAQCPDFYGSGLRLEQADGAPARSGRFTLTATAAVTAGSGTLTFSASMSTILFPYLSIIELTSGANTLRALVTAVSGTTVTIDTGRTNVTWTAAAATVTRIHGVGPILTAGTVNGLNAGASLNCPAFVYVPTGWPSLDIEGAKANYGDFGQINGLVLANTYGGFNEAHERVVLIGCDPLVCPDPGSPYVRIVDLRSRYGLGGANRADYNGQNNRAPYKDLAESVAITRRVWSFAPEDINLNFNWTKTAQTLKQVADETNTQQFPWVWHRTTAAGLIPFNDDTLPSDPDHFIRFRTRVAWDGSGGASCVVTFAGNGGGGGPTITLPGVAGEFQTYEVILPVPAQWQGVRTSAGMVGFYFEGTGFYLQGVTIEEITPVDKAAFPGSLQVPVKAGVPADADYNYPRDGMFVADSTNNRLYARVGGTWRSAPLADVSTFIRTLLDDADAAAAQTTLGVADLTAANQLSSGETTLPRLITAGGVTLSSGTLRFTHFTAAKTETRNNVSLVTAGTAAGATPTLVRVGVYSVAANGDLTLIASTPNDTTLLAATSTVYTKALSAPWSVVAGARYAVGPLVVTAATAPIVYGVFALTAAELARGPRLASFISGQTDLPASVPNGSLSNTSATVYVAMTP